MSTDIIPGQRLFNALNGRELAEIILAQVKAELHANYHMKQHLTYPRVKFKWNLTVEAYPLDPPEFVLSTEGEVIAQVGEESDEGGKNREPYVPPKDAKPEVVNLSGEQDEGANVSTGDGITPPDKVRTEAKLPVSRVADGPKGVLVEKPVARSTEIRKGNPAKQDKSGG